MIITIRKTIAGIWAATTLSFVAASFAAAQDIPKDLLELDRQRCSNDCLKELNDTGVCEQLCDCTVNEFQKRLNFDIYLTLSAELAQSKLSDSNRKIIDDIAKTCSANIKWPDAPAAAEPLPLPKPQG